MSLQNKEKEERWRCGKESEPLGSNSLLITSEGEVIIGEVLAGSTGPRTGQDGAPPAAGLPGQVVLTWSTFLGEPSSSPVGFSEVFSLRPQLGLPRVLQRGGNCATMSWRRRWNVNDGWDETTWSEDRCEQKVERGGGASFPPEEPLDEVTKMVQENSQDIKSAGNVGGKGAVKRWGGGCCCLFV